MTTMEPAIIAHDAIDHNELPVHTWRVVHLTRLGLPGLLADIHADHLGWHQIARLVQRGRPRSWPFASSADDGATHAGHARRVAR